MVYKNGNSYGSARKQKQNDLCYIRGNMGYCYNHYWHYCNKFFKYTYGYSKANCTKTVVKYTNQLVLSFTRKEEK